MKRCNTCRVWLPLEAFNKCSHHPDGLQYKCKTCLAKYVLENAEKIKLRRQLKYRIGRERQLANFKIYRDANPEVVRKRKSDYYFKNAEKIKRKTAEWKIDNPERSRILGAAHAAKRRALTKKATPSWYEEKAVRGFYETAEALNMWTGEWHEVDHVVPLSSKKVCGLHVAANLQILTSYENISKGNRWWPQMWD